MKKQALFIIFLIIIGLQLTAQKTKDVLYLKNGSIIYGKLIEADSIQYKFQTSDGSILIYRLPEVEKYTKEVPWFDGRKSDGFIFSLETGLLIGPQNATYPAPFSFDCLAGYSFNARTSVSLGSGVVFIGRPFTPLLLEFRQVFYDKKVSPYILIRGGAIIPIGSDDTDANDDYPYYGSEYNIPKNYKAGGSFSVGTGISWAYEDYELNLSFAYRYAHFSYQKKEYSLGDVTYKENVNRLELKIGFRF